MELGRLLPVAVAGMMVTAVLWVADLPDVRPLKTRPPKTTAYIELRRRQAAAKRQPFALRWTWVPYDRISNRLKDAVIIAEDDTYWVHDGVDWDAMQEAVERDRREGRPAAGGSTITMQLARNLYLSPSKNPLRKLKEMLIARRLQSELGRQRVFEIYLNVAEWGQGIFGCEAAARAYFRKACADLTAEEAVAMAVVLPNPRRWDPAKRGRYVERNSRRVIRNMAASGLWPDRDALASGANAVIFEHRDGAGRRVGEQRDGRERRGGGLRGGDELLGGAVSAARGRDLAVVVLFTALAFAPFLGKAFHNDEPSNLAAAAHIASDPRHPYDFDYDWFGRRLPFPATSSNPPLFHYLLAGALRTVGDGEFALRLCFLPLNLLAALSLYLIAARFLKKPLLPALILIAGPAYLINLGHLMGEMAAAAFGFAGLAALLESLDAGENLWYWGSAALLDAALLCKFHAVLFLVPAAAESLRRGIKPARVARYLATASAGLAAYLAWDAARRGGAISTTWDAWAETARLPTAAWSHRLRSLPAFVGGCGVVTVFWPFLIRRPGPRAAAILAGGACLLFAPWLDLGPEVRPVDRLTGAVFAAGAAWSLWLLWRDARTRPGWVLWASWAAAALAVSAAYWSVTSRVVLFALPPLVFSLAALFEARRPARRLDGLYRASLALTAALTLLLALVDFHYAAASKDFAGLVEENYLRQGRRVWYTGAMGLQYYVSRAGGRGLDVARGGWDEVRRGDVVLSLRINSAPVLPRRRRVDARVLTLQEPIPLRLISAGTSEAGFYSNVWGFLPFGFSREPLEEFTILEAL